MWICRKCHQRFDVAGSICRACGGIVEQIPEGQLADQEVQVLDAVPPPSPEPSGSGATVHMAKPPVVMDVEEVSPEPEFTGPAWKCQRCDALVPGNFNVCWKCLATKTGEPEPNAAQLLSETGPEDQETEPGDSLREYELLGELAPVVSAPLAACVRCGCTQLMRDVTIMDQGEYSDGELKAVVVGNPQAIFFKDRLFGKVKADICGRCGHMELRVANPGQLYQRYLRALETERGGHA